MATIEQRANELYCDADGYVKDLANDYMRIGYIKGATDTIKRAIEMHCELCVSKNDCRNKKYCNQYKLFVKYLKGSNNK